MKFLITGGSGFIGSHLAEALQHRGEVRILDDLRTGFRHNLDGIAVQFTQGSILDQAAVKQVMEGVDYVFHLAAMVSVPESVSKPRDCEEMNGLGFLNVLEAATAAGAKKVFFASSAAIYGDNPTVPKLETMLPEPKSPYAFTKLLGEHYCRFFHDEGRVKTAALRFFNVFGPRQDPKGAYAAAVPIFIEKALKGEDITVHGDGDQTRDFIFVKDIVAAIMHVTLHPEITGVHNAGYGGTITVKDLAEEIIRQAGSSSRILRGPVRAGDVKHSRAAVDKLLATGFVPVSSLKQGLEETVRWFSGKLGL
jgi:UDP-glucose 4-epimerase